MKAHVPSSRRIAYSPGGNLFSVWCSCGWVSDAPTKHPRHLHREHVAQAKAEAEDRAADSLMRQAPRGRRYE